MKKKILLVILITFIFATIGELWAQHPPRGGFMQDLNRKEEIREKIEIIKLWKMSDKLNLTEEQAAILFPRLRNYRNRIDSLYQEKSGVIERIKILEQKNMWSDQKELQDILDRYLDIEEQIKGNWLLLAREIEDILTLEQQVKLIQFEFEFRYEMRDLIHSLREEIPFEDEHLSD
ncbi:hypothetical protein JW877_02860 [bacterium]|nr:hypothetical protein [bacterium]